MERRVWQCDDGYHAVAFVPDDLGEYFAVWVNLLPVGITHLLHEERHVRWACVACGHASGTKRQMMQHVVARHYLAFALAWMKEHHPRQIEAPAYLRHAARMHQPRW